MGVESYTKSHEPNTLIADVTSVFCIQPHDIENVIKWFIIPHCVEFFLTFWTKPSLARNSATDIYFHMNGMLFLYINLLFFVIWGFGVDVSFLFFIWFQDKSSKSKQQDKRLSDSSNMVSLSFNVLNQWTFGRGMQTIQSRNLTDVIICDERLHSELLHYFSSVLG